MGQLAEQFKRATRLMQSRTKTFPAVEGLRPCLLTSLEFWVEFFPCHESGEWSMPEPFTM